MTTKIKLYPDLKPQKIMDLDRIKGFVSSTATTYNQHRPLYIDPKVVWITIVSQIALIINYNAEKLRSKFVNFDGKKTLTVYEPGFFSNPSRLTQKFINLIDENIVDEEFSSWIATEFSTSTEKHVVVARLMIMGSFKKYFNYCVTRCGIPEIKILGTEEDWLKIKNNFKKILEFKTLYEEIEKWYSELNELMDNFILAKQNKIDVNYWKNFVRGHYPGGSSARPCIEDHCIVLNRFIETLDYRDYKKKKLIYNDKNILYFTDIADEKVDVEITYEKEKYKVVSGNMKCIENSDMGLSVEPDYQYTKIM